MLFSKEVIDLYEEIAATPDPADRYEMLIELAEIFVGQTDDTDHHLGEDIHALVTDFLESRVNFERKAMSLARVLMRSLPTYVLEHAPPEGEEGDPQAN